MSAIVSANRKENVNFVLVVFVRPESFGAVPAAKRQQTSNTVPVSSKKGESYSIPPVTDF
ncbi:MAG: hypothetical protein DMG05_02980 [Acidobacteria bacterium]|nr:MAG: hypothetical protein DMG05_02980 [Acidobacteriota bacterium]